MINPFANGISPELLLDILRRRRWLGLLATALILTVMITGAIFLPNIYTARAVILVEGQQIPQDYVRSTVTMGLERRLQILSQEILSRDKILQLAQKFDLYETLKERGAEDGVIVAAMRRDVGVQITGRSGSKEDKDITVVFEVNYTGADAQKVMEVANAIAASYIEGNVKVREQQASGTSEFLRSELDKVGQRLQQKEQQVVDYKQGHMGELPEQLEANLSTLQVLQKQMEVISNDLTQARERQSSLLRTDGLDANYSSLEKGNGQPYREAPIETLKRQLSELKLRFSDKHPDVIRLKQQIAGMEKRLIEHDTPLPAEEVPNHSPARSARSSEMVALEERIKSAAVSLAKVQEELALYKRRIENTPKREQEMAEMTRDYTAAKDSYANLLKRLEEAKLAGSLEQRQKAERFRLLESAVYPQQPAGPKRLQLVLLGCVFSIGAAIALMVLWEAADSSLHRVEDLQAMTPLPILGTIPKIVTQFDLRQERRGHVYRIAALTTVLLLGVGASYFITTGNEQLTRVIVRPTSGVQTR